MCSAGPQSPLLCVLSQDRLTNLKCLRGSSRVGPAKHPKHNHIYVRITLKTCFAGDSCKSCPTVSRSTACPATAHPAVCVGLTSPGRECMFKASTLLLKFILQTSKAWLAVLRTDEEVTPFHPAGAALLPCCPTAAAKQPPPVHIITRESSSKASER